MAGWCSKVACGDGVKGRGKASNISGFQSFQSSSVGSIMFYRFSCLRIRFSSALQVASWSLLASIWQLWRLHQDTPGTFGGNLGQYRGKQRKLHTKSGYQVLSIMVWSNPVLMGNTDEQPLGLGHTMFKLIKSTVIYWKWFLGQRTDDFENWYYWYPKSWDGLREALFSWLNAMVSKCFWTTAYCTPSDTKILQDGMTMTWKISSMYLISWSRI